MRRITSAAPISIDELRMLAPGRFRDIVKGVVDLRRGVLLIDADMHADQEAALLAEGSNRPDLWGINLYPQLEGTDWIEFDSLINLRPSFGNRSRGVDDATTREAVRALVESLVRRRMTFSIATWRADAGGSSPCSNNWATSAAKSAVRRNGPVGMPSLPAAPSSARWSCSI